MHWIWLVQWVTWLSCHWLILSWSHDPKTLYILFLPLDRDVVGTCSWMLWTCTYGLLCMLIELWTLYFMCNLLEYFMDLYLWNYLLEYFMDLYLWTVFGNISTTLKLYWTLSCVFKRITARTWTLKEQLNCFSTLMLCLKLLNEHIFNIFGETGTSRAASSVASPAGTSPVQLAFQGEAQHSQPSRNQPSAASPPRAFPEQPAIQGPAPVQPAHQGLHQSPASTPATQGLHHVLHKLVSWFQSDILFNILQE